jgi:hypothetical protein
VFLYKTNNCSLQIVAGGKSRYDARYATGAPRERLASAHLALPLLLVDQWGNFAISPRRRRRRHRRVERQSLTIQHLVGEYHHYASPSTTTMIANDDDGNGRRDGRVASGRGRRRATPALRLRTPLRASRRYLGCFRFFVFSFNFLVSFRSCGLADCVCRAPVAVRLARQVLHCPSTRINVCCFVFVLPEYRTCCITMTNQATSMMAMFADAIDAFALDVRDTAVLAPRSPLFVCVCVCVCVCECVCFFLSILGKLS